jgi:hypothetical protein
MMSSSTKISISSPKSTTIGPKVRRYSVTDKREETRFIYLLDGGLCCDTSSKIVEVTSSYTLVFLSFPFFDFSLAFSSYFFFFSTSFKRLFFKTSLTFSAFSLSYTMSSTCALSFKPANALASNTFLSVASKELNLSFSKSSTCCGLHSKIPTNPPKMDRGPYSQLL